MGIVDWEMRNKKEAAVSQFVIPTKASIQEDEKF
jgi:hypothetical protein